MYLKPHHEDISWYMSPSAAKSTLFWKPVPQPKFGDSTTGDCQHITERKKAKPEAPVSSYITFRSSAQLFHHLLVANHTESGQSGTEMPTSRSWRKSFRALFLMLKKVWPTSMPYRTKSQEATKPQELTLLFPYPPLPFCLSFPLSSTPITADHC